MAFSRVVAAVAVADMDRALVWYERLFGRPFDACPSPGAAEWKVLSGGDLLVALDPERAGQSVDTIGVDDVAGLAAELRARGLKARAAPAGKGPPRLVRIADPDGNIITFAEDPRPSPGA